MTTDEHATAEMRRIIDNQARSLAAADVEMRRLYAELDASRTALDDAVGALLLERAVSERARDALERIDRHVVGAYALSSDAMPEPCEECGEMREIAHQALAAMKKARTE